jgi:hypothetical protein
MRLACLFLVLAGVFSSSAGATENELELHRLKAQKSIDAKDWSTAETEAKAVVDSAPQDLDGWLMYGIVEQRLEHNDEASRAYRKYLDLNPPADKAAAVRDRLATVELRSQKSTREESTSNEEKYGPEAFGIYFAFSPVYDPSTASKLDSSLKTNFQLGVEFSHLLVGGSYSSGSVTHFLAPQEGQANPTYTSVGPATLKIWEFYLEYDIPLNQPFGSLGPFVFSIPIHLGGYITSLPLNDGSRTFGNMALDGAFGVQAQYFTRTPFVVSAAALWHSGLYLTQVEEDSLSQPIKDTAGDQVTGGNAGFEFRLTVSFLFPHEKTVAEKALAQ